jgi:hypothetical protein
MVRTGVANLQLDTTIVVDATAKTKSDTTNLRDDTTVRHNHDLMRWICPVDYHVQHQDFIDRHQTGTGQWLLRDSKFQEWNRSKDATLLCLGLPGTGKTFMTALIIDYLLGSPRSADSALTFIYCDWRKGQSEQSLEHMLSSILRQIFESQHWFPERARCLYAACAVKGSTPSRRELQHILQETLQHLDGLTIVVDALDECETRTRDGFLLTVKYLRKRGKIRLLATSRFLSTIQTHPAFRSKPKLEIRASDEDLELYVRSRMGELCDRFMSKPVMLEEIVSDTVHASAGMYV